MKTIIPTLLAFLLLGITLPAQTQDLQSGYAPVNGMKMYYEVHGQGPALILIHGSFMNIPSGWSELIPELSKTNQVIAIELQGHGRTEDIGRDFSFPNFASDVAALMDFLKIKKANVLGYSMGGTVALQLAVNHPEKVDKIVFISSVFNDNGWIPEVREAFTGLKPEFFLETPIKTDYDRLAPDKTHFDAFMRKMIAFANRPHDVGIENISQLKNPIFIINGDYDGVDLVHSQTLFRALGGGGSGMMEPLSPSRFAIVPGTTHITLIMQTEKLLGMILPFLAEKPGAEVEQMEQH